MATPIKSKRSSKSASSTYLRKVGVQESALPHVLTEWHKFVEFDYALYILGGGTVPDGVDPLTVEEWQGLRSGGLAKIPTREEIRRFLQKHGLMTAERDGYLADYEYYRTPKSQRRPEVWKGRMEWGRLGKNR